MKKSCSILVLVLLTFTACDCESTAGSQRDVGLDPGDDGSLMDQSTQADLNNQEVDGGNEIDASCGIYRTLCEGTCVDSILDPANCGGCNNVCEEGDVCVGGQCMPASACAPGHQACAGRCVDTFWENEHCGGCGSPCPQGTGCLEEECVPLVEIGPAPAFCQDGGPPIRLEDDANEERCAGNIAEFTFRFGLCSCDGIITNNPVFIDAFDSRLGPYEPGGPGGGMATNGSINANEMLTVSGSLWAVGDITVDDPVNVGQRLYAGGNLTVDEVVTVDENAYVGGNIQLDAMNVGGILHVNPDSNFNEDNITYQDITIANLLVEPPCVGCLAEHRLDIPAIVAAHQQANDNGLIGLAPDIFASSQGNQRLELPCGRYYLDEIVTDNPVTIVATGNTAIFIAGDVITNNEFTIAPLPGAQLDVFVAGNFTTNNQLRLGSPNYPAMMRLYIGGAQGFTTNNEIQLGGFIYAVPGGSDTNNEIELYGGLFTQDFTSNNEVEIHFDRAIGLVGRQCTPDGGGDPNGGMNNVMNNDPGPDPFCISTDGACGMDEDCCAPLQCVNGTCSLLSCVPSFAECSDTSQCCTGICAPTGDTGICIVN